MNDPQQVEIFIVKGHDVHGRFHLESHRRNSIYVRALADCDMVDSQEHCALPQVGWYHLVLRIQ